MLPGTTGVPVIGAGPGRARSRRVIVADSQAGGAEHLPVGAVWAAWRRVAADQPRS
jgi:hypothetical protein